MYYHCEKLEHVIYGKIYPYYIEDNILNSSYKWLSQHCGYFPQIWLSRSSSCITGIRMENNRDSILFGFEDIQGFPLDYNCWCRVINCLIDTDEEKVNERFEQYFVNYLKEDYGTVDKFLKELFSKNDQVIVPILNLKTAKKIICNNEKQKKKLRQMGFIEDRIIIRNIKKTC